MSPQNLYDLQIAEALYREHLSKGNRLRFRATGGSMWPLVRSGDIVHVEPADRYLEGDILLYERGEDWVVHRLIRHGWCPENHHSLILRGDALERADPSVPPEAVLGRVVRIERGARLIRLNGFMGVACRIISRIPILRYPVMPWGHAFLGHAKRCLLQ